MDLFDELENIIGGFGDLAKTSVTYYSDILGMTEDASDQKQTYPTQQPSYQPVTNSTSKWPFLILIGLVLFFVLRK